MLSKRKDWPVIVIALIISLSFFGSQVNAETGGVEFYDVQKQKPYASAVYQLAERNIIGGYQDGSFKPGASITRGQAAAIIAKLLNLDTKTVNDPGFKDVSSDLWSYGAISAVAEKGIFRGYGDGRFGPNDNITRAQMASILIKAFDFYYYTYSYSESPFTDIVRLASHQDSVYTLFKLGITSGTSSTTFSPNDPISRAQAAVLITKTERVRASTITLKASDYGWFIFKGYNDYHNSFLPNEQQEEEIVQVIRNKKASGVLQVVPIKEGMQKFTLTGQKKDTPIEEGFEYKKYFIHVSSQNGRLITEFEETETVIPTNVRLNVRKELIEKVSLTTMDGIKVNENIEFQLVNQYQNHNVISILLTNPSEYIATVHYANGTKIRYGIKATLEPSDFYFNTYSIEENPTVTVDLTNDKGDFSEYKYREEYTDIANVTREEGTDVFHIEGLSSGNTFIDFPNSDRSKEGTLGLGVWVRKVGSIINVEVNRFDYYDQFY